MNGVLTHRYLGYITLSVGRYNEELLMKIKGELGFDAADNFFISAGRIKLLKAVDETGSISQAAKHVGLSYKAAWDAIQLMNEVSESPLVLKKTGGAGGGGAELSPYAAKLITSYDLVNNKLSSIMSEIQENIHDLDELLIALRRLSMKTSVRNQYFGKIKEINLGKVNAEVIVSLKGGDEIAATITKTSVERLGLKVGGEAFAMVKASSVIISDPSIKGKLSVRNFLTGTVEDLDAGEVNAFVTIKLEGGSELTGVITKESLAALGLKKGSKISGAFKASSVIIGVND